MKITIETYLLLNQRQNVRQRGDVVSSKNVQMCSYTPLESGGGGGGGGEEVGEVGGWSQSQEKESHTH